MHAVQQPHHVHPICADVVRIWRAKAVLCGEGFCCLELVDHSGFHLWPLRLHANPT